MNIAEKIIKEIDERISKLYMTANKPGYNVAENIAGVYALTDLKSYIQSTFSGFEFPCPTCGDTGPYMEKCKRCYPK